ncbi:hypothetical protein BCR42DRAFT_419031 [Absidia repens]|uniref:Secreted protein n=1 Tax=Absidia repens TaxID=90262 RepID=A0A1X2IAS9_9FUNG|nr:hypothetical protein BCR42DRAFT_419031 [Absidia repens]
MATCFLIFYFLGANQTAPFAAKSSHSFFPRRYTHSWTITVLMSAILKLQLKTLFKKQNTNHKNKINQHKFHISFDRT